MQDVIKRNFWVVGVLAVIVCATFAAKAAGHIVEAQFLGDAKTSPKVTPIAREPVAAVKPTHDKNGQPFEARNMFCSECTPPVVETPANGGPVDGNSVSITTLPLSLLATNIGATEEDSYATVVNTSDQRQGAFAIGDRIPGASGVVKAIKFKYIDFENNGRMERLVLFGATPPAPPPVAAAPEEKPAGDGDEMQAAIDSGIKKVDDTTFEIDKALVDKVLVNPMAIAKGARVVPSAKGFKLYAIRPSSVFSKLGLSNGDTLSSINGMELTTAEKALEVYTKLKDASNLEMEVIRRGKPVSLKYTIRN